MSDGNGAVKQERWQMEPKLLDPTDGQGRMEPKFPGWNGLPFRGEVPDRKEADPEHMQPKVAASAHVEVLDMSKVDDLKRYEEVSQMVTNGFAVMSFEERQYDEDTKNWRVFIRWGDLFAYNPEKGHNSGRSL